MKVFLTGATGYVGSAVLARLLTDGHEVVAHARSAESADRLLPGALPRSVSSPTRGRTCNGTVSCVKAVQRGQNGGPAGVISVHSGSGAARV